MLSILSLSHDSLLATHSSAVLAAFLTLLNAPEKAVPMRMLTSLNLFQRLCAPALSQSQFLYTNTPTAISASNTVITKPTGLARKAAFKPVCATVAVLVAAACPPSKPVIVSTVLPSPSSAFPPELTVRLNSANFTRAKAAANSLTPVLSVLVCSLHHAIESPAFCSISPAFWAPSCTPFTSRSASRSRPPPAIQLSSFAISVSSLPLSQSIGDVLNALEKCEPTTSSALDARPASSEPTFPAKPLTVALSVSTLSLRAFALSSVSCDRITPAFSALPASSCRAAPPSSTIPARLSALLPNRVIASVSRSVSFCTLDSAVKVS